LAEAERLAETALAMGLEIGQPDAFTIYGAQVANIRYHQGRLHELLSLMEAAVESAPALHGFRAAIALAYTKGDDFDSAGRLLEAALSDRFSIPDDEGWMYAIATWAQVAADLRHDDAAAILHSLLSPWRRLFVHHQVVVSGAAAMHLGQLEHVLGRLDDADRSFAQAEEVHQRLESPMLVADGNAHWAAMLLDRDAPGDRKRAHELASGALDVAVAGGYGYTEALARKVLARLVPDGGGTQD
jgi:tetratricopeptide (TPR) repeat protein